MAALRVQPTNRVRFAFWGAEEFGLLGAEHYLANLPKAELKNLMLNLNFDMVGSPNYVRFVYDGDGSATGTKGPSGSGNIERVFLDYFASQEAADRADCLRRPLGLRAVHRPRHPGRRSLHRSRGDQVRGGGGRLRRHGRSGLRPVLPRGVRHLSDQRQLDGARPDGGRDRRCDLQFAMTTSSTSGTGKSSSSSQQSVGDFKGSLLRK